MVMFSTLDDDELDALLAGTSPANSSLAPVAEVVQALRRMAASEPVPPMSESLRAQLASPVVVPIGIRPATWSALVKAAAVAAGLALVGFGAAQNRLPSGIQDVVSSTVDLVGIHVPRAEDRHAGDEGRGTGDPNGDANGHDDTSNRNDNGNDGAPGHDGVTPGGAVPADPGTPGDQEPATPAMPPITSNGGGAGSTAKPPKDHAPSSTIPNTPSSTIPNPPAKSNPSPPANEPGSAKKAG